MGKLKYTTQQIIEKFRAIHGDKYDYSKVTYKGFHRYVDIICTRKHGIFKQEPAWHLSGRGCKKCADDLRSTDLLNKKLGKLKVIRKASKEDKINKGLKLTKSVRTYWWVKCSCGRDPFLVRGENLRMNENPMCKFCADREKGLRQKKLTWGKLKSINKFGLLSPLRPWGSNKASQMMVLCLCDCGKQHITRAPSLLSGKAKSCGCVDRGDDSYEFFIKDIEYSRQDCFFYIADLDDKYIKIGITINPDKRRRGAFRSYEFISPLITRATAWTIEQILLEESKKAALSKVPTKYQGMSGQYEIRLRKTLPISFYQTRYKQLIKEISNKHWQSIYLKRFPIR